MSRRNQNLTFEILAAIILYIAVIVYQGYQYGQSDQSQILPILYAQDHHGSYTNDHYVKAYLQSGVNERTIFHFLLRFSGYDSPWLVFIWHALFSLALIVAWIRISGLFISNKNLQYACVACMLIIGFHSSVGSNEIYYNQFVPSLAAKAIASWAIYFWIKNKYGEWAALLILSCFLQPLVGLQLFIITVAAQVIASFKNHRKEKFPLLSLIVLFLFIAPWIFLLAINNGGRDHPSAFMDIMEFRLSHHFFPSYFGFFNLLIFFVFAVLCVLFYKGKLKWFVLVILAGCILYVTGVEILRLPLFLYTQWWKSTIWIESFGFIAIISLLESGFYLKEKFKSYPLAIPIALLLVVSIYRLTGLSGAPPTYMAPFSNKLNHDVEISLQAKKLAGEDAVFIIPPDLTAFRWYSKRSTFVDHKALFHQEDFLMEWYRRIKNVYDYDLDQKRSGITFQIKATEILSNPDNETIAKWRSLGITHLISKNPELQSLKLLGRNSTYSIYQL